MNMHKSLSEHDLLLNNLLAKKKCFFI